MLRRTFLSRPKLDGLWLRLTFRDGDVQEAVMPNNLLFVEPHGFQSDPAGDDPAHLGAAGSPYLSAGAGRDRRTRKRHEASQSADERSDRTLRTLGSSEQPETEHLRQPGVDDFARSRRDIVFSPLILHESGLGIV